jgi:hypothetical protein
MFMYDVGNDFIDFYSTDSALLAFLATELAARFGAFRVESGEIAQTGEMIVYFKGSFDSRYVEHYLNQMLCGNGWEPYDEGCFKLRYEG